MADSLKYTVMMSVYSKVDCGELKISVDSMLAQTLPPSEFVIVKDGPLTESLDKLIDGYVRENPGLFKIIGLKENKSAGSAYKAAAKYCSCEYIAIMDSDDYSLPERCLKQARFLNDNPEIDIVGSSIYEFTQSTSNIVALRQLPQSHEECVRFAKRRCPCAQPSTMLRRSALLRAGGYRRCPNAEDYDLYVRMIMAGCRFHNFKEPLVYMRVSDEFYNRRGGLGQLKKIISCKWNFYKMGFYSIFDFAVSLAVHTAVCVMPNGLRRFIYVRLLRKSIQRGEK